MKYLKSSARILLILIVGCVASVFGQTDRSTIRGTIIDQTGAVVPGAEVTIRNAATGTEQKATTSEDGFYTLAQLQPGVYRLTVQRPGYATIVQENITLSVEQQARLDFTLQAGEVGATVTVTAEAPILSQETSSLGTVVDREKIVNLPLNGRSLFRLVQLTPGVISSNSANGQFRDVPVNTTFETNFSINGGRNQSNEILIDGVPSSTGFFNQATTIPTVEATQEFKVQSNNASAEFGRFGGGVVNVSTRSGGNSFDGSLYEFVRNDAFDANDFFNNRAGRAKPPFRMNQFGYAVSGPVFFPRFGEGGPAFYNGKNKTFFFTDYQGTRWRRGDVFTTRVPTLAERGGDFSAQLGAVIPGVFNPDGTPARQGQIYDPATTRTVGGVVVRDPFQGNIIPQNRINPIARNLLAYYPSPNAVQPGSTNNFISNAGRIINADQFSGRLDHNVTETWRIFGRYSFNKTDLTQPDYFNNEATPDPGAVGTTKFRYHTFVFDNTVSLDANTILNVKLGFARWFQARQTRSFGFDQTSLGFSPSLVSRFQVPVFPLINVESYSSLAGQSFLKNGNDTYSLLPSITKTLGRQILKFGADIRLRRIDFFNVNAAGGTYNFNRVFTRGPNFTTNNATVGNGVASLLLGAPAGGSAPINSAASLRNFYFAGYVQDDIKITPKLTVNLGFRYDVETPYTERYNRLVTFDFNAPNPARNAQFPNLTGALEFAAEDNPTVYRTDYNNFAPRLGFAYSIFEKTVIRAGFGISYSPLETSTNAVGLIPQSGFSASTPLLTTTNGGQTILPAFNFGNPFPNGLNQPTNTSLGDRTFLGQDLTIWDPNAETPYYMQWNVNLQRELPFNILFDIAYAGSRGVHLTRPHDFNALDPQNLSLGVGLQTNVANPFQPFVMSGTLSQATVQRRQLLLPFPEYTNLVIANETSGNSIYHSLQTKLEKRLSGGVNFLLAYTFSKLISDVNNQLSPIGDFTNVQGTQNPYNLRLERSLSELDTPHALSFSTVIELPFGKGRRFFTKTNGFVGKLIEGFQLNAIARYESGNPLGFSSVAPIAGGNRPNATGESFDISGEGRRGVDYDYFNRAALAPLAAFQLGNLSRTTGAIRAPAYRNFDISLIKNTRLTEGTSLQLRAEFFNIFNIVNLGLPNTNLSSPNYGRITATRGLPRVIQFAAKFNF